ncbi:MAG: type II toxin-antitoxin system VapC family toxin [Dehalococcoidia bacterium]
MTRYCLDASFLLAWPLAGPGRKAARDILLSASGSDELISPVLLWSEVTSSLRVGAYRGVITRQAAMEALEHVLSLPIRPVHRDDIYSLAMDFGERLGWAKAYDALYLATAEIEGAHLLTLDRGLHEAAVCLGIPATLIAQ